MLLLLFEAGRLKQVAEFEPAFPKCYGFPHVYSMAIHDGKLCLGFDKIAAVVDPGGSPIEAYTLIDREAEEDILRQEQWA